MQQLICFTSNRNSFPKMKQLHSIQLHSARWCWMDVVAKLHTQCDIRIVNMFLAVPPSFKHTWIEPSLAVFALLHLREPLWVGHLRTLAQCPASENHQWATLSKQAVLVLVTKNVKNTKTVSELED